MNVLILMAGASDAFREAGYLYPKSLVEVEGLPLVQRVIEALSPLKSENAHPICMVTKEDNTRFHIADVIRLLAPRCRVLEVERPTAGAACTALLAIDLINTEEPLLIVNGDLVVHADLDAILHEFERQLLDGGIVVFEAVHPRWSYVRCDESGLVVETAEKRPISNLATVGIYYFARGGDFVRATMQMIKKDAHVEGSFYVCPVYNEMILCQARIGVYRIPREAYFSLSNPQGVHAYEEYLRDVRRKRENL